MRSLNPPQRKAVRHIHTPLLVLAGAGSGKTRVITRKIAYLARECDIAPRHITAVTFTNKAAREMQSRVREWLDADTAGALTVGTFHHLGLTLIREEHRALGLRRQISILDDQDSQTLLLELLGTTGRNAKDLLPLLSGAIHRWKNDLVTPEQALTFSQSPGEEGFAKIYQQYTEALLAYNAVDFDDLIGLPVHLLREDADIRERWQNRIRYLLVDEYQDTNSAQYELVRQLVGVRGALTVVGDDDQSIYAWRGARPENLARLREDFPQLTVIKLEQNYRSTGHILQSANRLISHNPHVFDKRLWSELGPGEPIRAVQCSSEEMEVSRIAQEIHAKKREKSLKWSDFAVLYRGNHQARGLEVKLQELQVPYQVTGGTSFFSRAEVKDTLAYLRLLVNPNDDAAFLRIANVPRRKLGPTTLKALGDYARQRHQPLLACAEEFGFLQGLPEASRRPVQQFTGWLHQLSRRCATEDDPLPVLREMLDDMGYDLWLRQNSSSPAVADRRMENVWFVLDIIRRSLTSENVDFEEAVARLVLRDMLDRDDEDTGDRVQLMTLHAAKGLEFPHVYIMGVEENLLPHRNSIEADTVEEERRLAYVGVTRARRSLTLTLARKRQQFGETVTCTPSRFLDELPTESLRREGFGDEDPEAVQGRNRTALDSLHALLDD